jgi:hypothetical protein
VLLGKGSFIMWMGTRLRANGGMIRLMGKGYICILMGPSMRASGRMTCRMD